MQSVWKSGFLISLFYHAVLLAIVAIFLFLTNKPLTIETLRSRFGAWDGDHYVYLATHGYKNTGDERNFIVFYPLYPILIRLNPFSFFSPYLAAVTTSISGSLIGHTILFVYLKEQYPRWKAYRIYLLFLCIPTAIYFAHIYTEGVFFALTTLFLYLLSKRKYTAALIVAFFCTLTRNAGITTLVPYILSIIGESKPRMWKFRYVLAGILIPAAYGIYALINMWYFGDPFYWIVIQRENFNEDTIHPILNYVEHVRFYDWRNTGNIFFKPYPTLEIDTISTLLTPLIIAVFALINFFKKQMHWGLIAWAAFQLLAPITQSFWRSNTRYIFIIIPLLIMIESLAWKVKPLYIIVLLSFLTLSFQAISIFSQGGWLY